MSPLPQCCFVNVETRLTNEHSLINFYFHPNVTIEATFGNQFWNNIILSSLKQRGFVKVETMSINIRRFNFHFQPNNNVERTLNHPRWNNAIFSKLFQLCFVNIETTSINVIWLKFHFTSWYCFLYIDKWRYLVQYHSKFL